jgi:hypothetical protein
MGQRDDGLAGVAWVDTASDQPSGLERADSMGDIAAIQPSRPAEVSLAALSKVVERQEDAIVIAACSVLG